MNALRSQFGCLCVILIAASCSSMREEISGYRGDGVVTDISWTYFGKSLPGYLLEFPSFSLAQPYHGSYRLANLPSQSNSATMASLAVIVALSDANEKKSLCDGFAAVVAKSAATRAAAIPWDGNLRFTLRDRLGNQIWAMDESLAEMTISSPPHAQKNWALIGSREQNQRIPITPGTDYYLDVTYQPGTRHLDRQAHLRIQSGGTK